MNLGKLDLLVETLPRKLGPSAVNAYYPYRWRQISLTGSFDWQSYLILTTVQMNVLQFTEHLSFLTVCRQVRLS